MARINVDTDEKYVFMQKIDPNAFDDLGTKISHFVERKLLRAERKDKR